MPDVAVAAGTAASSVDAVIKAVYHLYPSRYDIKISRLRTDFSALNATRHRLHQVDSPACEACGARKTRTHFLLHCPVWEHLRPALQRASYGADLLGAVDVSSLLAHPKLPKALVAFIAATFGLGGDFK
ncbi:hypothetical protein DFH09DRAFT_1322431 [Mycena vulgaris]|nr:hypothetical protein DFH09DRAFT_1322431 [Mycena vulgaris]